MTHIPGNVNPHPVRRDRFIREHEHNTYKLREKLHEPTICEHCGVVFHEGRWQWSSPSASAHKTVCPACRRMRDNYPGGYLNLSGQFLRQHRDDILHLARNVETKEKAEHPMLRIMTVDEQADGIAITTTEMNLARAIGEAIAHAYRGELDYKYSDETDILHVSWRRDT